MITAPVFAGKRYAVLGLARTGQAVVAALVAGGAVVTAWDAREEPRAAVAQAHGDAVELVDPLAIDLAGFAGVVVSPGVPINRHPIADAARAAGVPLIGDIELFAQSRGALPPHKVIGITGTNGKSTTTALTTHLLQQAGVPALMGGNIGLPHRMERVAEAKGVLFINDSKATNPASTAPALAAFPAQEGHRRIHWIVGGLPKGDDLDDCAPFFGNVAAAYTIGDAGQRFAEILSPAMPVSRSEMMCEAIRQAIEVAVPGDVVLLSPACASFDQFRDYEARGAAFRQLVEVLTGDEDEGADCTNPVGGL